jgi:hypothetical protein
MKTIVDTYNNNNHRTLNNKTPNQIFKDNDDQIARHLNDSLHNQQIHKSVPFNDGDKVRILKRKRNLIKENKNSVKSCILLIRGKDTNNS